MREWKYLKADDVVVDAFEAASHIPSDAWLDAIAELDGGYVPDLHGETLPAVAKASTAPLWSLIAGQHYSKLVQ